MKKHQHSSHMILDGKLLEPYIDLNKHGYNYVSGVDWRRKRKIQISLVILCTWSSPSSHFVTIRILLLCNFTESKVCDFKMPCFILQYISAGVESWYDSCTEILNLNDTSILLSCLDSPKMLPHPYWILQIYTVFEDSARNRWHFWRVRAT